MVPIQLKPILENYIKPMFTGSELSERQEQRAWKKQRVFLKNLSEMVVRASQESSQYFVLRRSQAFNPADVEFVRSFVERLHKLGNAEKTYIDDLINPIMRLTVAEQVAPEIALLEEESTWPLISKIIATFENWAEQTYEGQKISASVGVDVGNSIPAGASAVKLLDIFNQQFGVVLTRGLESFLTADRNGMVVGYEPANSISGHSELFAPLRFCYLANWTKERRVGLALSRNGEILVFAYQRLVFAKRRGVWRQFTQKALIQRMCMMSSFSRRVCEAVYQTCLDVSFAKSGGGIALIKKPHYRNFIQANIVSTDDCVGTNTVKGQLLRIITGKPFNELDRHLRQDIVAMDGSTILDYQGKVLAAGAIVKVDAGSEGGGRLAAAKTLAKFGQGIKISSDGEIRGFRLNKDKTGVEEFFTVG